MQIGWVIYHELIHMVSHVADSQRGYAKAPLVELAANEPELARNSANNYMLYTA